MLNLEDFIEKYELFTDEELYDVLMNLENYSEDAGKALKIVIDKKGGQETLIIRLKEKQVIEDEKARIATEALYFGKNGEDASFLKNTTNSTVLSKKEVNEIIEKYVETATAQVEDKKVNSDTIIKSISGGALASLVGGAFASLQFIYFGATSFFMMVGVALICYFIVKFITKKSFNNTAVLLSSFIAFILSYLVAYLLFLFFGYLG